MVSEKTSTGTVTLSSWQFQAEQRPPGYLDPTVVCSICSIKHQHCPMQETVWSKKKEHSKAKTPSLPLLLSTNSAHPGSTLGTARCHSELFLTSFLEKSKKLFFGRPCVKQGIGHNDPGMSLTTQDILWIHSVILRTILTKCRQSPCMSLSASPKYTLFLLLSSPSTATICKLQLLWHCVHWIQYLLNKTSQEHKRVSKPHFIPVHCYLLAGASIFECSWNVLDVFLH